ncbi:hypothetical protein AVEN_80814-1 [Araneus ventricosus]|uniref:RNase H type-1 domain-containing protein n=1 Tax=Araneus ventricosus TaxID=182803 RepID=A0A4Y2NUT0_ARAVE|nr:hypothetical protein AVEN_80814-1 [Araneus ventricosus]
MDESSLKAIKNTRTTSPIAREIQEHLYSNEDIRLGWIKDPAGRIDNEMADMLAKEAITSPQAEKLNIPVPRSNLKRELRKWAKQEWDKAVGGRTTHKIHPKVFLKPTNWPREVTIFVTGHGPFPSYLRRFHLHHSKFCTCGLTGSPLHYATVCPHTKEFHMTAPSPNYLTPWLRSATTNKGSKEKLVRLVRYLIAKESNIKETEA